MGNICIIGPRSSGKTTYLAGLAYKSNKSKKFKVKAMNDDSKKMADAAENIICPAGSFEATKLDEDRQTVDDFPYYSFNIKFRKFWFSKPESFQLNLRDFPGEVCEKILLGEDNFDAVYKDFVEEWLQKDVIGCLILLPSWEKNTDNFYNRLMNRFIELMDSHDRLNDLRLAVAMSKCERGELWPGRLDPEMDLFKVHLPKTTETLRDSRIPAKNLRFYAISTFGVMARTDPRPNREDRQGKEGEASVLRDGDKWQPYNLVEPLYWLGKQTKIKETK